MQTDAHNKGREERALLEQRRAQWHANCVSWQSN